MKPLHALTLFLAGEAMATPIVLPLLANWNVRIPGVGSEESEYTKNQNGKSTAIHNKRDMSPAAKGGIIIASFAFMSLINFVPDLVGKFVSHIPILGGWEKRDLQHLKDMSDFGDIPGTDLHEEMKRDACADEYYLGIHTHVDCSDFSDIPGTDLHKNKRSKSRAHQDEGDDFHERPRTELHESETRSGFSHHMKVEDFYKILQPTDLLKLEKRELDGKAKTGIILGVVGGLVLFPILHEIASYVFNVPFAPASPLGIVEGIPAKRDTTNGQEDQDEANPESTPLQIHRNHKRMDWKAKAGIAGGVIGFFLTIGYGADIIGHLFNPFRGAVDVLEVPWGMGKRDVNETVENCVYRRPPYTDDRKPNFQCVKIQMERLAKRGHKHLSAGAILGLTVAGLVAAWAPMIINRVGVGIGLIPESLFKRDGKATATAGNKTELLQRQLVTGMLDITDNPEAPEAFIKTVVTLGEGLTVDDAEALWNYTRTVVSDGTRLVQKRLESS